MELIEPNDDFGRGLKRPPADEESERSVLGALLTDNALAEKIDGVAGIDDFYAPRHRIIFGEIIALMDENKPADAVTVASRLRERRQLDEVGGAEYLADLTQVSSAPANIRHYAEIVRKCAMLRKTISELNSGLEAAYFPQGRPPQKILDEIENRVFAIGEHYMHGTGELASLMASKSEFMNRLNEVINSENKSGITGIPSGFNDLDNLTTGFQPGDLIIIAGRPSMGKTSLALNIARHAAEFGGKGGGGAAVGIFSMEMAKEQLIMRLLCTEARVDQQRYRKHKLSDEDVSSIYGVVDKVMNFPIFIDESGLLNIMEVRARTRRWTQNLRRQNLELGMIIVDYLQLMDGNPAERNDNRALEVSSISRGLKSLARELNTPVIALSQLNRAVDSRPNNRPFLSDLRDSGSIEQDADLILFIYREEVHNPDTPDKNTAEIIIGKQRNGPTGSVKLTFLKDYTRFENFADSNRYSD